MATFDFKTFDLFNAKEYLELNADVAEAGYTEATAWDHYVQYGAGDLRAPNALVAEKDGNKLSLENVFAYGVANPDVTEAFGVEMPETADELTRDDVSNLVLHYVMFGSGEDREAKITTVTYDDIKDDDGDTIVPDIAAALEAVVAAQENAKEVNKAIEKELGTGVDLSEKLSDAEDAVEAFGITLGDKASANTKIIKAKEASLKADADLAKAEVQGVAGLQGKSAALAKAQSAYETAVKAAAANVEAFNAGVADLAANGLVPAASDALVVANADGSGDNLTVTLKFDVSSEGIASGTDAVFNIVDKKVELDATAITFTDDAAGRAAEKQLNDFKASVGLLYANAVAFADGGAVDKAQATFEAALAGVINAEAGAEVYTFTEADGWTDGTDNITELYNPAKITDATTPAIQADATPALPVTSTTYDLGLDAEEAGISISAGYVAAEKELADFQAAAKDFNKYNDLQNQQDDADKAVEQAQKALEVAAEKAGLELHEANDDSGTDGNDLFVFGNNADEIYDFGTEGDDLFYFGPEFSLVRLDADADLNAEEHGSLSALEIFAQEVDGNVVLSVEAEAIAGNSIKGFEGDTITLVGVKLEDLDFADGFLFNVA